MHRRINITLPEETIRLLDRLSQKGHRSRLIDHALRHYVKATGHAKLRSRLKEGAIRRAKQDQRLAEDWFFLDEEAWIRAQR